MYKLSYIQPLAKFCGPLGLGSSIYKKKAQSHRFCRGKTCEGHLWYRHDQDLGTGPLLTCDKKAMWTYWYEKNIKYLLATYFCHLIHFIL